ncbi:MAG: nucleotide exchange factor GrpE [Clostridia bacterium]|nr:nucleotide exchange factor GrpE [Clostridia bacterium]
MMDEKRTDVPETELKNEETVSSEEPKKEKKSKLNDEAKKISEELEKTKEELEEMKRKYLVMLAEYDNFRKRAQKERESAYSDAYADAITALLPVFDNIERANTFAGTDGIAEGLNMIINQFKGALAGLGIEAFGEVGEDFDPNFHNAIMQTEDESLGENVIAEVFQKGYKRGDKIIRFAMVKVANCG